MKNIVWDDRASAIAALSSFAAEHHVVDADLTAGGLRDAAPLVVPAAGGWMAVARVGRSGVRLRLPGGGTARRTVADVCALVAPPTKPDGAVSIDALLAVAAVPEKRRSLAAAALTKERHATAKVTGCVSVRPSPGSSFLAQCRRAGLVRRLAGFVAAHAAAYVLLVVSWVVLGRAALAGDVDGAAVAQWAVLLAAAVPCELIATRLQSSLAVGGGRLLRRRLLHGALRLEPEEVRGQGVGQLLGRTIEAEAVEDLAVGGGLLALVAGIELVLALFALGAGPGLVPAVALMGWVAGAVVLARRYLSARRRWADARLELTDDMVEKLLGHRTRLAQQPPERFHDGEASAVASYDAVGRVMDRRLALLVSVVPRGWVAVGALGLWAVADGATAGNLAAGAGGVLLAAAALQTLVTGVAQLVDAGVSWEAVRLVFSAGSRPVEEASSTRDGSESLRAPLLVAESLSYAYPERDQPALAAVDLQVSVGERVLVEGPSGSGKSTLVSLVSGLRTPTQGAIRLAGQSLAETGSVAWRRRVVASPQDHENHLVLGSLAFNLLLGRSWPASPADLDAAWAVCEELGLGPVLARMPSGLQQIVGESGWQLSHGERSLVYLARALLQDPDILVLDETFGALDPVTLHRALIAVLRRASTVIVVHQ